MDGQVDVAEANRFISRLAKSLQVLCHSCMQFDFGIEIVGYININIDCGSKVDYVLNEKVLKSTTNSTTFVSNSFLAKNEALEQTSDDACSPVAELRTVAKRRGSSKRFGHLRGSHKRTWPGRDWRSSPKRSRSDSTEHSSPPIDPSQTASEDIMEMQGTFLQPCDNSFTTDNAAELKNENAYVAGVSNQDSGSSWIETGVESNGAASSGSGDNDGVDGDDSYYQEPDEGSSDTSQIIEFGDEDAEASGLYENCSQSRPVTVIETSKFEDPGTTDHSIAPVPAAPRASPNPTLTRYPNSTLIPSNKNPPNKLWAGNFQINWEAFDDHDLLHRLKAGEMPLEHCEWQKIVRFIVKQVHNVCPTPQKRDWEQISMEVVNHLPGLKDPFLENAVGSGDHTLLNKLQHRNYNLQRLHNGFRRNVFTKDSSNPKKSVKNIYNCINFLPVVRGPGADYMEFTKTKLKEAGPGGSLEDLKKTYPLQRRDLLSLSAEDVRDEWPLLFSMAGLSSHFEQLTGTGNHFSTKIEATLPKLVAFLKATQTDEESAIWADFEGVKQTMSNQLQMVVTIVSKRFEENMASCMMEKPGNTPLERVSNEELPGTPIIISCNDDSWDGKVFHLAVDRTVVMKNVISFTLSLQSCFQLYYLFNIQFPDNFCATLDLIQRVLFGIQPEKGPTRLRFRPSVHKKVAQFTKEWASFQIYSKH